jgi:hypothetical protein
VAFVRQTQMGAGADEIRAYRQPQDRQGARSRRAALIAWTRRQGDQIKIPFAAAHESVHGPFSDMGPRVRLQSVMRTKADVGRPLAPGAAGSRLSGRGRRSTKVLLGPQLPWCAAFVTRVLAAQNSAERADSLGLVAWNYAGFCLQNLDFGRIEARLRGKCGPDWPAPESPLI